MYEMKEVMGRACNTHGKEIVCENTEWIYLAQDRVQCRNVEEMVMNFLVLYVTGKFWII
jgi:hypothetical protein